MGRKKLTGGLKKGVTLSLVFSFLVIITSGCRLYRKTTSTTTIDTTIIIPEIRIDSVKPLDVFNNDTTKVVFDTPEATVEIYSDRATGAQLRKIKSKLIANITIKKKSVNLQYRQVTKTIEKVPTNDGSNVKEYILLFIGLVVVIIVLIIILKR